MKRFIVLLLLAVYFLGGCTDESVSDPIIEQVDPNIVTISVKGKDVEFYKQGDKYYLYDDVVLSQKDIDDLILKEKSLKKITGNVTDLSNSHPIIGELWPDNTVYYWHDWWTGSTNYQNLMQAISIIESNTRLNFVKSNSATHYIAFSLDITLTSAGISNSIGMKESGSQYIKVSSSSASLRTFIHEIGHAIGFGHEHQRPDRDQYLDVDVPAGASAQQAFQFDIYNWYVSYGSFDWNSVMLYNSGDYSGGITMYKTDGSDFEGGSTLSTGDIATINYLYPELQKKPKINYFSQDPDPLPNGGTGYVTAHLLEGTGDITYNWYASSNPSNITLNITPEGNRCKVHYYTPYYSTLPTITLTCVAQNSLGTDVKSYQMELSHY